MNTAIRKLLFWVLSPVLVALLAAPLFVGHVVVRLLIARIQRRSRDLRDTPPSRTDVVRTPETTWESPMLHRVATRF